MKRTEKQGLTFGIMLVPSTPWQRLEEQASQVESLGFDKLWLPDHFVNPEDREMDWFDCWTTLAALTSHTDKIGLGTLVSSMTLRNPAMLARMALTVDHISGGRLELGVGAGGVPDCHTMTGVPQWDRRERSDRYKEYIEILDHMLSHDRTTYQGTYYSVQDALMRPASISKPRPVFSIAAHGPRALQLAAKYGDAWNTMSPGNDLTPKQHSDNTRQRCDMMSEYASELGRDPKSIGRTMLFGWTSDRLFNSEDAFCDTIGRYHQAGIKDFCFIYALGLDGWEGQAIVTEDQLLQISKEYIPASRDST